MMQPCQADATGTFARVARATQIQLPDSAPDQPLLASAAASIPACLPDKIADRRIIRLINPLDCVNLLATVANCAGIYRLVMMPAAEDSSLHVYTTWFQRFFAMHNPVSEAGN